MNKRLAFCIVAGSAAPYVVTGLQDPHIEPTNDTAPLQQARSTVAATTSAASSHVRLHDLLFIPGFRST